MIKQTFLAELAKALDNLPADERRDIVRDYEEYFVDAEHAGRSDAEVIATLGQPAQIAKQLTAHRHLAAAKQQMTFGSFLKATLAVLSLTFFNAVFILTPLIALAGVIIACWIINITLLLTPAIYGIALFFRIPITNVGDIYAIIATYKFTPNEQQAYLQFYGFLTIAACGFGLLGCVILNFLSRFFVRIFIKYMQFNVSVLRGSTQS